MTRAVARLVARTLARDRLRVACASPAACAEVFWAFVHASSTLGLRLFLLGAPVGAPARVERMARGAVPGARIVGTYAAAPDRLDTPRERARIASIVRLAAPDVLVLGLEDAWVDANEAALGVPALIALRAVFQGKVRP